MKMKSKTLAGLSLLALAACTNATESSVDQAAAVESETTAAIVSPAFSEVASFPSGTFLENVAAGHNSQAVLTSYFEKKLYALSEDGQVSTLADLPDHPVGIIQTEAGYIVTAHGKPFSDQPAFTETNKVLILSMNGDVTSVIDAPSALFLNGALQVSEDRVLVADSLASTIWALDLESQSFSPWLQDDILSIDPNSEIFRPGANGLKQQGEFVFVSNSARGTIHSIAWNGEAAGDTSLIAQTGPVDDFVFSADGSIYATSHGDALLKVDTAGNVSDFISEGCGACTSALIVSSDAGENLLVLTTGHLLEGGSENAQILSVPISN